MNEVNTPPNIEPVNPVRFGKVFWPSLVAGIAVSIIGLIIWLLVIFGIIGSFGEYVPYTVKENSILHMKLEGNIGERGQTKLNPSSFSIDEQMGVAEIIRGIQLAKTDKKIKGIYIELSGVNCGYATARELRKAIDDFETSGKFVVAYNSGEAVGLKEYYIASAANESYGFPNSNINFLGLGGEITYFKNTFDKLDIEMQVIRGSGNDFKSAVEPLFRENMSDSSRLQVERYMTSIWDNIKLDISKSRKVSVELLDSLADNMMVTNMTDAAKYKMIDKTLYKDEVMAILKGKLKGVEVKDINKNLSSFKTYARRKFYEEQIRMQAKKDANIAVILAEGGVNKSGSGLTSDDICKQFRKARENESIKVVVFRVNSPGGSALASDEIWREVELTNKKKKVIVSMGDVAASGGYYIAAPAHRIFAEPTTITGSIGVFGVIPFTGDMLQNKLGITFDRVSTNDHAVLSTNRRLTEGEMGMIQKSVDDIYTQFKSRVSIGRKMSMEQVEVVARGRVWTGEDAKRVGLVDELGGLNDAINYAKKITKLSKSKILYYPLVKEDKLGNLLESLDAMENGEGVQMKESILPKALMEQYLKLKNLENMQGVQMRMEYDLEMN